MHDDLLALMICIQARCAVFLWGAPGIGKCLGQGTPVLRYDGTIAPVESIAAGDLLMGPDSRPRRVVSLTHGAAPLYRVVPLKGEPWVCNGAHVLTLVHSLTNEIVDMPLDRYLALSASKKHHLKLFQPPFVDFAATPSENLTISPYFLGIWLGDGTKDLTGVAVSKPDAEIELACRTEAARFDCTVRVDTSNVACPTYCISKIPGTGQGRYNPLLTTLRGLMSDGIRVPHAYLTAAASDRAELLAGLLDTDGCYACGCYEIVQRSKLIADDIAFLARSLGLRVTRRLKYITGYDAPYHRLFISGNISALPLRIARKMAPERRQKKNALRTGFRVESAGNGAYYGFTLDGDGRFLLGDFTVTHNSASLEAIAAALDEKLWTIILSIREPSDQGGLPIITPEGVKLHPPLWATQLVANGGGIVLWDEFNAAPPTTQSSALRVIHGGWAGDLQLPLANTSFVAAGNPTEVSTGAFDLTSAIANRWTHLYMPVRSDAWIDGMTRGWPAPPVQRLPVGWRDDYVPAMRALVVSFIRRMPTSLCVLPESIVEQGRAWPSPRSWDRAATLLGAAQSLGHGPKSAVGALLVRGCVGEAAYTEFSTWIVKLDLRDPEEYLANPNLPLPDRQDQLLVTLDGVVTAALQQGNRSRQDFLTRYSRAWAVLGRAYQKPDISRTAATALARSLPPELDTDEKLPQEAALFLPMLERAKIDLGMQR